MNMPMRVKLPRLLFIMMVNASLLLSITTEAKSLVTAPLTSTAPVIDGKINEASEWNDAVRFTNFLEVETLRFAADQTTVWLCHDRQNLYVAMKMNAMVLEHASQMRSRFFAQSSSMKDRSKLNDDDNVEFRLLPPWAPGGSGSADSYMLKANANSVLLPWGPKGGDWPRGIVVKGAIEDGFWVLEMKIPLMALGRSMKEQLTDKELSGWKFNVIRFEQNRKEISSWENIAGMKYGNTEGFGVLNLATDVSVPALQIPDVTSGKTRELQIGVYANDGSCGSWNSELNFNNPAKTYRNEGKFKFPKGSSFFKLENDLSQKGQYGWTFSVSAGNPEKPIFHSPDYQMQSELRIARLELPGFKSISEILLNRKTVKPANEVMLIPGFGANILEIASADGTVKLRLDAAESEIPMPIARWEYLEGNGWRVAKIKPDGGFVIVSAPDSKETRFRAVFYEKASALDFLGDNPEAFHIPANGTCGVIWYPTRMPGFDMMSGEKNVILNLWLPEWLEVAGASSQQHDELSSSWYAKNMTQGKDKFLKHENFYDTEARESLTVNGETLRHYTISAKEIKIIDPAYETSPGRSEARTKCMIALRTRADAAGKHGRVRCSLSIDGKPELPWGFNATVLPKLEGAQPKHSRIAVYLRHFQELNAAGLMDAVYSTVKQAGANEVFIDNRFLNPEKYGLSPVNFFNYRTPASGSSDIDIAEMCAKYPGLRTKSGYVNLSYLARNPEAWEYADREFAAMRKRSPYLKTCFWDYEFRPFANYSDLSEYTLKIFAGEYNIKEALSQDVIQNKYLKEWVEFRSRELGKIVPKTRELAHKNGLEFTMYLSPDPKVSLPLYSIDFKDVVSGMDFAYLGGSWNSETTLLAKELCRKNSIRFLASVHTGKNTNNNWKCGVILRRLIISDGGGVLLWYEKGFDGLMYQELAAVTRLLSRFEDFFQKGKAEAFAPVNGRLDYAAGNPTPKELRERILGDVISETAALVVYELDGEFLALAVNDTNKPVTLTLNFKNAAGEFEDFDTHLKYSAGKDFQLTIKPYEYSAFSGRIAGKGK